MSFQVISVSLARNMNHDFRTFIQELEGEILSWPLDVLLGVFPEYCWRKTHPSEVFDYIDILKTKIRSNLVLVLGTLEFVHNGSYTANGIVLHNSILHFIPKTKVLNDEVRKGLSPGINPGVIEFPCFRLGVLDCADLWEPSLLYELVIKQGANIIAVPAWTNTLPGYRDSARQLWHSLARTESIRYGVVIIVADHLKNYPDYDVGNATVIFTPDNRNKKFPTEEFVERDLELIDLEKVQAASQRWKDKGLAPTIINS